MTTIDDGTAAEPGFGRIASERVAAGWIPEQRDFRRTVAAPVRDTPRWTAVPGRAPDKLGLPLPPGDDEKYLYYGKQHLWFIWLRTLATVSGVISLLLFSISQSSLWLFWIPMSVFVMYMVLTHYATTRQRRFSLSQHRRLVGLWNPEHLPSIDVFLPSAGEEIAVLNNTYRYVAQMRYAGRAEVYVLDDADRPEVAELARSYRFNYLVRPDRPHMKKAGNLKHGFEHSDGDLIVIFDADFAPRADFLLELVPYFDDPRVGIVQSPQYFDTGKGMHWLQQSAGSVQESFYRWAQVSRDNLGAPICVGTCAIYRRAGLERSGGFAQIGHSEDVHTGVNLMKAGFRTTYVPIILAKGLCPDKLSSFISQQYRWCAGSMSLLRDKKFHDSPLTYRQRMCFFTGFGYYISTAIGVFCLPLPTLVMLWFMPERVQLSNFFWMVPAFAMYPLIRVMHKSGWRASTLRVYTISSFSHAAAILHTLRGRTAEWVPTGETRRTSMTSNVTTTMVLWLAGTNVVTLAGVFRFLYIWGGSVVDVGPILLVATLNASVWLPILALAWKERAVRREAIASTALVA
jgi:cellulose synthase (UDP-forming)